MPSAPCFRMNAFWASESFDDFIVVHSSRPWGRLSEKLQLQTIQFSGLRSRMSRPCLSFGIRWIAQDERLARHQFNMELRALHYSTDAILSLHFTRTYFTTRDRLSVAVARPLLHRSANCGIENTYTHGNLLSPSRRGPATKVKFDAAPIDSLLQCQLQNHYRQGAIADVSCDLLGIVPSPEMSSSPIEKANNDKVTTGGRTNQWRHAKSKGCGTVHDACPGGLGRNDSISYRRRSGPDEPPSVGRVPESSNHPRWPGRVRDTSGRSFIWRPAVKNARIHLCEN
jgi:hypothetical protein